MAAPAMIDAPDGGVADPIGTGPFTFVELGARRQPRGEEEPELLARGPALPRRHRLPGDPRPLELAASALESGTVDMIEMGEADQIINLTKEAEAGKLQIYTNAGLQTNETFSALNVGAPPFDDPLARQIVAYGTDRDTLSKSVFAGVFPPALGPFNEDEPAYTVPRTCRPSTRPRPSSWPTSTRRRTASRSSSPTCSRPQPEVQALGTLAAAGDAGHRREADPQDRGPGRRSSRTSSSATTRPPASCCSARTRST